MQTQVLSWARLELCLWGRRVEKVVSHSPLQMATVGQQHGGEHATGHASFARKTRKKAMDSSRVVRWALAALSDKPALLLPPARPCQGAPGAPAPPPRHRLGPLRVAPRGTDRGRRAPPELSRTPHLSKPLLSANNKTLGARGAHGAGAAGPGLVGSASSRAGRACGGRGETQAAPLSAARSTLTTTYK